jgi:hypothetical protein
VCSSDLNFDAFSKGLEKSIHSSYPFKILWRICTDTQNGKRYNPLFYLSRYKNLQYRFLGDVFLASHIAPVIVLIMANFTLDNLFDVLLSLQFIWYVLIIAGQRLLSWNYVLFEDIYYRVWYDKLLNYDMLSMTALKDKLFKETYFVTPGEINKMLLNIHDTFKEPVKTLLVSSEKLSAALEKFAAEKEKGKIVTVESVIVSLEANLKRLEVLCEQLENSALLSKESYKELYKIINANKIDVNAVNTLANEFSSLRNTLADYTNAAETAAVEKLANITSTLENSVNKTFSTIETTLKTNAQELSKTYDRFFEICKVLVEKQEKESE